MDGLMMDFPLTLTAILRRAETYYPGQEVVSRLPDRSFRHATYAEVCERARRLAVGLRGLGLRRGDRVATLAWNHQQHLEAYLGVPAAGLVCHTLNLRLHPDDLAYIAAHAGDRAVIVDRSLVPLLEQFVERTPIEHVLVVEDAYEDLLARSDPAAYEDPGLAEGEASLMCYTSGTTGRPKGVLYSHRSTVLHSLAAAIVSPLGFKVAHEQTFMPVVPMFHANAWGYPITCLLVGAKLVFPGPHLDPHSLLEDMVEHRVTASAGVPTIWMGILRALDEEPGRYDLSRVQATLVGGAAVPRSLAAGFWQRHRIRIVQGWGMTELSPIGTMTELAGDARDADEETVLDLVATQGRPLPFVELRARDGAGVEVPWDGESMGELEVRGPFVAASYHDAPGEADRWTDDGWFRTGDVVAFDPTGTMQIKDRAKDLIKSGGEWISSVELENALMGHPAVLEAAVIAVPDERWDERPLAAVVLRDGAAATAEELRAFLAPQFAKWWLPDRFEFVDAIPKTGVGKFRKTELRERFAAPAATEITTQERV